MDRKRTDSNALSRFTRGVEERMEMSKSHLATSLSDRTRLNCMAGEGLERPHTGGMREGHMPTSQITLNRPMDPDQTDPPEDAVEGFFDGVAERVTDGMGTRHVAQLLPEEYPREPDPPDVWKDEEAMGEWIDQLPERDEVVVLRIIYTSPENQQFENETRPPNS